MKNPTFAAPHQYKAGWRRLWAGRPEAPRHSSTSVRRRAGTALSSVLVKAATLADRPAESPDRRADWHSATGRCAAGPEVADGAGARRPSDGAVRLVVSTPKAWPWAGPGPGPRSTARPPHRPRLRSAPRHGRDHGGAPPLHFGDISQGEVAAPRYFDPVPGSAARRRYPVWRVISEEAWWQG